MNGAIYICVLIAGMVLAALFWPFVIYILTRFDKKKDKPFKNNPKAK